MSEHCGFIVKIEHLRKHSNADRLQVLTVFGNDTCVSLDAKVGDLGVYFPTDLQLSEEFCHANHLCRKKLDGTPDTGYMDNNKRNVTTIRLRGEKSDGLYLPIHCFDYIYGEGKSAEHFEVGMKIEIVDGHEICKKYIPNRPQKVSRERNKVRKNKVAVAPLFREHADTEQLAYNLAAFKPGDIVELTLKMHGTSQRTGYLPVLKTMKRSLLDKILHREGTPVYDWGYVTGTRRTVLQNFEGGYYGSDAFREEHSKFFEGKLNKGETVYYEVVGWVNEERPIMATVSNKATNDKAFIMQYGEKTTFSYGCEPGTSKAYVYRMTTTNEDGDVVELSPDQMRYRCEQMGANVVPLFERVMIPSEEDLSDLGMTAGDYIMSAVERYYDGADPIGKTHVREGVVARILNRSGFVAYKHKNFSFKVIEGIAKSEALAPDMEEAEEVNTENEI